MKKKIYVAVRVNLIDADVSLIKAFGAEAEAKAWAEKDAEEMLEDQRSSYMMSEAIPDEEYIENDVFLTENGYGTGTVLHDSWEGDADVYLWQVLPADVLLDLEVG